MSPVNMPPAPADVPFSAIHVYIGTYTSGSSQGIYRFHLDPQTGQPGPVQLVAKAENPSFLALDPQGKRLYAVSEVANFQGSNCGGVSSYEITSGSDELRLLNSLPSGGSGPCYVAVSGDGRTVLTANYGSGSVASFRVAEDGALTGPVTAIQHRGSGVNPERQAGPHAHCIQADPAGRYALAADLGLDKILLYKLNPEMSSLEDHTPAYLATAPGTGPRHLCFSGDSRRVYATLEMASEVSVFSYDADAGTLREIQRVPMLPSDFHADNTAAEVKLHPSGHVLYASNRGHDSLAIYRVDAGDGRLTPIGHVSTQGKTPRGFGIDAAGRYLIVANQESDNVIIFRTRSEGQLEETGSVSVDSPVAVLLQNR